MKILFQIFSIVGGACLGISAGLVLGQNARTVPKKILIEGRAVTNTGADFGQNRWHQARQDSSPLATQLESGLAKATGVTRWLYWWDAIEKAGLADFPRLARLAQGNRIITRLLAERWVELSPQNLFESLRATAKEGNKLSPAFASVLFASWLKSDRSAAIAALSGAEDFPGQYEWRREVATTLVETEPEAGLKAMSQWHIENYSPSMKAVRTWATADPRHAAEFAMANATGSVARQVMDEVGEVWASTAPGAALDFAISQHGDLTSALAQSVLRTWAERDLNRAAEWLAGAEPETRNKFSPAFVEAWAKQDAGGALAWCESNISGSTLSDAVHGLFNGAAQMDVAAAAAMVSAMSPSPARSQAATAVAEKWFPDGLSSKVVPPESVTWLSSLDSESLRKTVDSISWRWAEADPAGMASFLQSATNISFQTYTYENLARTMARNDPASAMDWTSRLPEGLGVSAGSTAFSVWGRAQPEAAMQWLEQLSQNDARRQPFFTGLVQELAWEPQATDRFAQIAATDPSAARSAIQGMALSEDRRTALLARLSAPPGNR